MLQLNVVGRFLQKQMDLPFHHERLRLVSLQMVYLNYMKSFLARPLFQRMTRLARAIDGYTEAPSVKRKSQLTALSRELTERRSALDAAVSGEVAELNRAIEESAVPRILARPVGRPTSQ